MESNVPSTAAATLVSMMPVSVLGRLETVVAHDESGLSPLDILIGRRLGLLALCTVLKSLPVGGQTLTRLLTPTLADYFVTDFPALIVEEEKGLLAYLNGRLLLGDNLDDVIRQVNEEHRQEREQAMRLSARCRDFMDGTESDWPDLCDALAQFADRQQRHLSWEDATIVSAARERLSAKDLAGWAAEMKLRNRKVSCEPAKTMI